MPSKRLVAAVSLLMAITLRPQLSFAEKESGSANNTARDAFYIDIEPTLLSHCGESRNKAYIKSDVTVRVNNSEAQAFVNFHKPLIRDLLLTNFSLMSVEALNSMDKKQQFQQELLTIIKKALMNEGEQAEGIEDLLFTSFAIYE